MTLFERLLADRRQAMKARQRDRSKFLGVLLADASRDDKNPDDETVDEILRSHYKATRELLDHRPDSEEGKVEMEVLLSYLPPMPTEENLRVFIAEKFEEMGGVDKKKIGVIMAALTEKYGEDVDKGLAAKIVKGM